jgi:hypothetical protein
LAAYLERIHFALLPRRGSGLSSLIANTGVPPRRGSDLRQIADRPISL